jgi:chloride channel protein, CIC family
MVRVARGGLFLELYALSIVLGLCTGAVASALHVAIDAVVGWHRALAGGTSRGMVDTWITAAIVAAPVGAVFVVAARTLCRLFSPEATGSGIQEVEGALAGERTLAWRRVIPIKFVGGVLAIGAGLSLGREGPSIHLGACAGRMLADRWRLGHAEASALIAAGAGAGLAAAFNAPLAGILFVGEELRRGLPHSGTATHVVIIACTVATIFGWSVVGLGPMLPLPAFAWPTTGAWPLFVVLGALVGALGVLFNACLLAALDAFERLPRRSGGMVAAAVGGFAGFCLAIRPDFVGEGAALAVRLITDAPAVSLLIGLLIVRTLFFLASYPLAVPGGLFAPLLALGAIVGLAFGGVAESLLPGLDGISGPFAVTAMAALVTATVRAPMTAIVLVAELTGTYGLLPAMIVASATASITAQAIGGRPIYEQLLARTLAKAGQSVSGGHSPAIRS